MVASVGGNSTPALIKEAELKKSLREEGLLKGNAARVVDIIRIPVDLIDKSVKLTKNNLDGLSKGENNYIKTAFKLNVKFVALKLVWALGWAITAPIIFTAVVLVGVFNLSRILFQNHFVNNSNISIVSNRGMDGVLVKSDDTKDTGSVFSSEVNGVGYSRRDSESSSSESLPSPILLSRGEVSGDEPAADRQEENLLEPRGCMDDLIGDIEDLLLQQKAVIKEAVGESSEEPTQQPSTSLGRNTENSRLKTTNGLIEEMQDLVAKQDQVMREANQLSTPPTTPPTTPPRT